MEQDIIISLKDIYVEMDGEVILNRISLDIKDKEFITLLGPSGCGKTTTLRVIGGFQNPKSGLIYFEGTKINDLPSHKRNVNTVFQKYALFEHLNVFDNIAFGLRIAKVPKDEIKKRVSEMLAIVDLKGYEKRPISKLSGGQQQRVAIARALVNHPKVLLLDEPLGALDLKLRKDMQIELKNIQKKLNITFIYVTHDQEEALTMSDTVVVMNEGNIQQIGSPENIYNEPANAFVADFIGEANIIDCTMVKDRVVNILGADFPCVDEGFGENSPVDVVIRPEDIELVPEGEGLLTGKVVSAVFKGVHYEMAVDCMGYELLVHSTVCKEVGSVVGINVIPYNIHIMKKMFPTTNNEFTATVSYSDTEENCCELSIEEGSVAVKGLTFTENSTLNISLSPYNIELVPRGSGDIDGYITSIIYKGDHYEVILESDSGHKWLCKSSHDEQVGTYVGMIFKFDDTVSITESAEGTENEQ